MSTREEGGGGEQQRGKKDDVLGSEEVNKVREEVLLDEIRVQRRDAIDLMRPNNRKMSHPDLLRVALLDDRHAGETGAVAGVLLLDALEEVEVDVVDDLEVAREEPLDERNGPLREGDGGELRGLSRKVEEEAV